ncbi:MFS transporter [Streptomyces aureus]
MTTTTPSRTQRAALPWSALLALGTAVFITSLTETLPAGVLPEISSTLGVSPGAAGQAVTVYAAGTALTAIPLAAATSSAPRKPLLLVAMTVFLTSNLLTAATPGYTVLLAARFLAGVAAGLAWAILAGYARRIAPAGHEGRAIAVAMTGIPLALSLGVPAGTMVGEHVGWRTAFTAVSLTTLAVIAWIARSVPSSGRLEDRSAMRARTGAWQTLKVPGVTAIMLMVVAFVLGHTIMYAYIAPFLKHAGLGKRTDTVLLAFGAACLGSIWYAGRRVDRRLSELALTSGVLFTLSTAAFAITSAHPVVWAAAVAWGLGWGGMPTLLQTAAGRAGGRRGPGVADTAQAILVTLWNTAMALGGIIGGALLQGFGPTAVATAAAALGAAGLLVVLADRHALPTAGTTR